MLVAKVAIADGTVKCLYKDNSKLRPLPYLDQSLPAPNEIFFVILYSILRPPH